MKDALRYLDTGEVGRIAIKPKEKGDENVELEDDKACTSAAAKKQKLAVNGTTSTMISQESSKLNEFAKDQHIPSSACTGKSKPISERSSSHCVTGNASNHPAVPGGNCSSKTVRKSYNTRSATATAVDVQPIEQLPESGTMKDEIARTELSKSKKKKDLNLPRRASKRLAGLPLDHSPELESTDRVRRAAVTQSNDTVASIDENSSHIVQEAKHTSDNLSNTKRQFNKGKQPVGHIPAPAELKTENEDDEKHEHLRVLPSRNWTTSEGHAGNVETDNSADEKPEVSLDVALVELWQDPCIAFAIKTLTGTTVDNSESVQVSSGSNNSELGSAVLSDHARKEEKLIRDQKMQVQHLSNTSPAEHSGVVEISDKEKPGSPINIPFADAWADPCIEFAIKTLTGEIPLDCDVIVGDYVQQKQAHHNHKKEMA